MQRGGAAESNRQSVEGRGADQSAPRSTPLTLVSGAIAGDDLPRVTATVAEALGQPVVIAIPGLGAPVVSPPQALDPDQEQLISAHAAAVVRDAAAASFTALIRESQAAAPDDARAGLVWELLTGPLEDPAGFLARARALGVELGAGATGICAQHRSAVNGLLAAELAAAHGALVAETAGGRLLGLAPLGLPDRGHALAEQLRAHGMTVAVSAPRRDPAALHEALREADILVELADTQGVHVAAHDETYRLLIGVLLRDGDELAQLRARTIAPLSEYDRRHDTDLVATLQAFLAHDGSTTETAEAMQLHRHTVGYRLSRVHEVSGLSPYESDGRERLSLGLKAHQILDAAQRRG